MSAKDFIVNEMARMDVYKGLSACYAIPEATLITQIKIIEQQLVLLGSDAFAPAVLMRSELQGIDRLEELKVEFARLFVGPYQLAAPPYGSIYLEGKRKIMGDSTIDAHRRYLDSGVDLSEKFKDVPDHITVELEFMHFLVSNEINAIGSEQSEECTEYLYRQKSFLSDHLGSWIDNFGHKLEVSADCKFYRNLARATRVFLAEDLDYLSNLNVYQTS